MRGGPGAETAGMPPLPCQAMMCDDDDDDDAGQWCVLSSRLEKLFRSGSPVKKGEILSLQRTQVSVRRCHGLREEGSPAAAACALPALLSWWHQAMLCAHDNGIFEELDYDFLPHHPYYWSQNNSPCEAPEYYSRNPSKWGQISRQDYKIIG